MPFVMVPIVPPLLPLVNAGALLSRLVPGPGDDWAHTDEEEEVQGRETV
jgi:hypothetical protein